MAKVVFFEKPGCMNNTRQKALLSQSGHQVEARDLLAENWTPERLRPFFVGLAVAEWFNKAAPKVKAGEIDPTAFSVDQALAAMVAEPLLIRRPLMEVGEERRCGFDRDAVAAWIGLSDDGKTVRENCPRTDGHSCNGDHTH